MVRLRVPLISSQRRGAGDFTAPVLSSLFTPVKGQTSVQLSVDTNEAGRWFWVITTSAAQPTGVQIRAGLDDLDAPAVAFNSDITDAPGTIINVALGLVAGTNYYAHAVFRDSSNNESVPISSAMFTTLALTSLAATGTPPAMEVGVPFNWAPNISGGTPPYTVTLLDGAAVAAGPPPGTTFNTITGSVEGIPT